MPHFTPFQQRQFMKKHGFRYLKSTLHCDIWEDDYSKVSVASRPSSDTRAWLNIRRDVRNALKTRVRKEKEKRAMLVHREPERRIVSVPSQSSPEPLTQKPSHTVESRVRNMGIKMWDETTKELIRLRIRELFAKNPKIKNHEVAVELNKEGFTNTRGAPLDAFTVIKFKHDLGMVKKFKTRKEKSDTPVPSSSLQAAKERIAKATGRNADDLPAHVLPSHVHVEPISAATSDEQPVISDWVAQILKDPKLSDSKKVKMLLMYLEG